MAKLPIHKVGGAVDTTDLTAVEADVLSPDIFIGSGSDESQQGIIPLRGSPSYSLSINGTQTLQPGHYSGGKVSQSIPTMGAQSIGPGAQMITIPTAGKYMTGNIIIRTTKNLIPSVIKKGVTVGGVTGGFEGYVITDPKTLYKYGTFNGIQSINYFRQNKNGELGTVLMERDNIKVTVSSNFRYTAIVFNAPINFDNLSTIKIRYESRQIEPPYGGHGIGFAIFRNRSTDWIYNDDYTDWINRPNPDLGELLKRDSESAQGGDFTSSVSNITGNAYLYLLFAKPGAITNVKMVEFE